MNQGDFISVSDIASGKLLFQTPSTTGNVFFTFQVQDDGGIANGGVDTDQSPNTLTFTIVAVNHAPSGGSTTVSTAEDTGYSFVTTDFGFADPLDVPANALLNVIIVVPPSVGTLAVGGVPVASGTVIAANTISSHLLTYTPPANANGNGLANFSFRVQDGGGTANDGQDTAQAASTIASTSPRSTTPRSSRSAKIRIRPTRTRRRTARPSRRPSLASRRTSAPARPTMSAQTLNFTVTNNNNGLFSVQPTIDASGKLTFTAKPNAHGTALVTVTLRDSGGSRAPTASSNSSTSTSPSR